MAVTGAPEERRCAMIHCSEHVSVEGVSIFVASFEADAVSTSIAFREVKATAI